MLSLWGTFLQPSPATMEVNVGWVQGGAPGGGVYGLGEARTTTASHSAGTVALAQQVAARELESPAFVVWPENGTDMDPESDAETAELLWEALAAAGVPILVGSIDNGPGEDERQTVSTWWLPDGNVGPSYVKRNIVPFGEYVPMRDILLPLIPRLEYVGRQSVPGEDAGVLPVELPDGREVSLGVLICYDLAYDGTVYDLGRIGSQLTIVQSSNAMYQGTAQIEQQFAITRVRAAELRREALVVTTSGISGFIDAYGQVVDKVADPGEHHGVVAMSARQAHTPATWLAEPLQFAVAAICLVLCLAAGIGVRRKGKP
jgi:apolipoprotein N-acyltransferase